MFCKLLCTTAQERERVCEDKGLWFVFLCLLIAKAMSDRESFIQIELYKNPHTGHSQTVPIVLSWVATLTPPAIPVYPDVLHVSIECMYNPCYIIYQLTLDAFSCLFWLFKTKSIPERKCLFFFPWKLINSILSTIRDRGLPFGQDQLLPWHSFRD